MTPDDNIDIVDFTCFLLLFVLAFWCCHNFLHRSIITNSESICQTLLVICCVHNYGFKRAGQKVFKCKVKSFVADLCSDIKFLFTKSSLPRHPINYRIAELFTQANETLLSPWLTRCKLDKRVHTASRCCTGFTFIFSSNDYSHLSLRVCCQLVVKVCTHT